MRRLGSRAPSWGIAVLLVALAFGATTPSTTPAQDICGGLCSPYRFLAWDSSPPNPHAFFVSPPTALPPNRRFIHWDLREFPSCTVPYARNGNGHADTDPGNEFTAVRAAADRWTAVTPAIVELTDQPAFTANNTAGMDGVNNFLWDGGIAGNLALFPGNPSSVIAVTCVWFNGGMEIQESDIVFNDRDWQWNTTNQNLDEFVFSGMEPFALADGQTLTLKIDGGAVQTITFNAADFADITMATRQEVRDVINAQIVGGTAASFPSGRVGIKSNSAYNGNHKVEITGGTAQPALGFAIAEVILRLTDVESIAVHEIGHFLGLHHTATAGPPGGPIMTAGAEPNATKRALTAEDEQALNFLYTPDLGDAADPFVAAFNEYQSKVHTTTNRRVLNGVDLKQPGLGPVHLFGFRGPTPYANDRFEWLGANMDDNAAECESQQVDADQHDDGVTMPNPLVRGAVNRITVTISHSAQVGRYVADDDVCLVGGAGCACGNVFGPTDTNVPYIGPGPDGDFQTPLNNCPGGAGDNILAIPTGSGRVFITTGTDNEMDSQIVATVAAPPTRRLHLNGYLDFAGNGIFDPGDLTLFWSGVPTVAANANGFPPASACTTHASSANFVGPAVCGANTVTLDFDVLVPFNASPSFYSRFRLDFGEDEGRVANTSGSLAPAVGVAQFGEVEDYPSATIPRRHYQCYETPRDPFPIIYNVQLDDQFGSSLVDVTRQKRVCNPANKLGEDPAALLDPYHLVGYTIKQKTPLMPRTIVEVTDQFSDALGPLILEVKKPDMLLLPSAKSLFGPPAPLPPFLDHFKCYKVRGATRRITGVQVHDQFAPFTQPGIFTIDVKKPFRLCVPVSKLFSGIIDPENHLMCYKIRDRTIPRFRGIEPVFINNQFTDSFGAPSTIAADHPRELCVPALKTVLSIGP